LRNVAHPCRPATDRARGLEAVGGTGRRRPGAVLRHVARAGRRAARDEGRLEAVRRTGRARAGAGLVHVADSGRRTALRPGVPGRVLAGVAAAVALVAATRVAVCRAGRSGGGLRVRRTVGAVPGAVLRRITLAPRGAAHDEGRHEGVRRTGCARAGAGLVQVADPRGRATHRPGVPRGMLAGVVRAVALVTAARIAVVRARRPRRTLSIRGAIGARPRAVIVQVALARR